MAGHVAVVPDSVGMRHLAELLSRPGQDIAAVDLVGAPASWNADQPLLDEDARRAYGRRVRELQAELNEAEDDGDHERETRARVELDWLLSELERVTGLGGRPRRFADDKERARTSVQKAIRRAVAVIHGADPLLGAELENRVVTGGQCSYQPAALGSVSERLAARS
jgi:hypothetical protein